MNKAHCTTADSHLSAATGVGIARDAGSFWGFVQVVFRLPLRALETVLIWQERASERQRLSGMDEHLLKDMGLSRADVERETKLPFWRTH